MIYDCLLFDIIKDSINFLILPETFLYTPIWIEKIFNNLSVKQLYEVVSQYPRDIQFDKKHYYPLNILVGATTLSLSNKSPSSKPLHNHKNNFYKVFNTTLHLKNHLLFEDSVTRFSDGLALDKYHKSKLVPGAEQMPFQDILYPFLGDKILQIGASTSLGNFSRQDTITIFHSFKFEEKIGRCDFSVAPIICYESIYGDYVRRFVHKGAEVIFIITNDGWWKDTSGYKQHNMYATLRAIETRRYIARSANTGISCVINPFGKIEKKIDWDVRDVIKTEITLNNDRTFYTQYGDVLGGLHLFYQFFFYYILLSIINFIFLVNKSSEPLFL